MSKSPIDSKQDNLSAIKVKRKIILLVNLGSPEELSIGGIAKFLIKFLKDRRVVDLPRLFWYPILYGIIAPFRSRRLLLQYKNLWKLTGGVESPLLSYTNCQAKNLQDALNAKNSDYIVEYAFCYVRPSVGDALNAVHMQYEVQELLVIPLYPQFSSTTTSAVFDQVADFYWQKKYLPQIKFNRSFANNTQYIDAITTTIKDNWQKNNKRGQVLVFSYHGLPQSIVDAGDLYYKECFETTDLVVKALGLSALDYVVGFQSKFGRNKWVSPATRDVLLDLVSIKNITEVDVICVGFVCECLETVEEIAGFHKKEFLASGGKYFNYIPCLNDSKEFTQVLLNIIQNF